MDLGIVVITLAVIFIMYRIGAIKLAQASSDVLIKTTTEALKVFEAKTAEKNTREFGKIAIKLADDEITRSSYKSVMRQIKELDKEQPTVAA